MGRHDIAIHLTAQEAIVVGEALTAHADYMQTVMALNPDWDRGRFTRHCAVLRAIAIKVAKRQGPVMLDVLEAATAHECVVADLERRQRVANAAGGDPTDVREKAGSGVRALASAAPKLFNAQRFASVGSWAWS
jgi:hypothetical protein